MKTFSKMMMVAGAVVTVGLVGCASRDAMTKEYNRLAALPPVYCNHCPEDKALDSLGVAVSKSYNFAHKLMKEYVAATETQRAYLGYMNDIEYYVTEEKMEEEAAANRVMKEIQESDVQVANPEEKMWPQVVIGIQATNALKPAQKLQEIAPVALAVAQAIKDCNKLKDSFKGFDQATVAKGICAGKIIKQATDTAECLAFLSIQFKRAIQAQTYAK